MIDQQRTPYPEQWLEQQAEGMVEITQKSYLASKLSDDELRDAWYAAMDRWNHLPSAATLEDLRWFAILMTECHRRFMKHPPRA